MHKVLTSNHRTNQLLATLQYADFAFLESSLKIVHLPKGKVIYEAGQPMRHVYFPHNAVVCLVNPMADGRVVEVASCGREGMFGLLSALTARSSFGRYTVQIAGTASQLPVEQIWAAFDARPNIRRLLLRYTETLLAHILQTVSCNAVHSVESRCCAWILITRDRLGQNAVPLTHEALSELLGVQRTTVSLVLGTLQRAGLIKQHRGKLQITDAAGLEAVTCECYDKVRRSYDKLFSSARHASGDRHQSL